MNNVSKGFSLVELLIAAAIAGILAAIAFPTFAGLSGAARIREAARDINSELRRARQSAITKNREYRICVDLDNELYMRERGKISNNKTVSQEACGAAGGDWESETGWIAMPAGININCSTVSGNATTGIKAYKLNPNGTSSSGTIFLIGQNGSRFKIIVTSTTGRVRIERYTGTSSCGV